MLCDVCKNTITRMWPHRRAVKGSAEPSSYDEKPYTFYPHHNSLESICGSPKDCYICYRIQLKLGTHTHFVSHNGDGIFDIHKPLITASWSPPHHPLQYNIVFNLNLPVQDAQTVKKLRPSILLTLELHPLSDLTSFCGALSSSTEISTCANIVRQWLKSCDELHPKCVLSRKPKWLPTRLLDLRNVEKHRYINLVLPDSTWTHERYATLSHCWGGSSPVKLTTATLTLFRSGIQIEEIPKTFIDAIEVALFLGIKYIWIDALTIIQDSSDDWAKEASHMGEVYQHSFISIGATASTDSHGGLFFERNPALVKPQIYTLDHADYLLIERYQWNSSVEEAPLLQRGWVVQERLFCTRMLHFSKDQLFWEFRTSVGCETIPENGPDHFETLSTATGFKTDDELAATVADFEMGSSQKDRSGRLLQQWHKIVEHYSASGLTFKSDKLIAISGMAKMFQRQLGVDYIAGMWKSNFIQELAWLPKILPIVSKENTPETNQQYVAPSWSWASTHHGAWYSKGISADLESRAIQTSAELLKIGLDYKSLNKFGQLTGGFIRMRAPLHEVIVRRNSPPLGEYFSHFMSSSEAGHTFDQSYVAVDNNSNTDISTGNLFCLSSLLKYYARAVLWKRS
jgi:hypothetical protein